MGRYQAYPEYKDSGVEWFDSAPAHWEIKRISYVAQLRSGDAIVSEQIEAEGEYPVFGGNGLRGYTTNHTHEGHYILIGRQGALCGNINYGEGKFWASEHAVVVHPFLPVHTKWLGETLRAMNLNQYNVSAAQPGLAVANITCLKIPFPTYAEQVAIANFLDHETAKIDTLIEKQQQLIQLLKEKRQAVISHAVTKGLNPNAPMKDSGVEWLGEVPHDWNISKFGFVKTVLTDYTANGSFADLKKNVNYLDEPSYARLVRLTDLRMNLENDNGVWIDEKAYSYLSKSALFGGEFLLANVGAYAGLFYQMPTGKGNASLAPNMFMAKFDEKKVNRRFIAYVGQSDPINKQLSLNATASSAQPKLNKDNFKSVIFTFPIIEHQISIANYLDHETAKIDTLIEKADQGIKLIQERRTALISAAVTGKIDVRHWQASRSDKA